MLFSNKIQQSTYCSSKGAKQYKYIDQRRFLGYHVLGFVNMDMFGCIGIGHDGNGNRKGFLFMIMGFVSRILGYCRIFFYRISILTAACILIPLRGVILVRVTLIIGILILGTLVAAVLMIFSRASAAALIARISLVAAVALIVRGFGWVAGSCDRCTRDRGRNGFLRTGSIGVLVITFGGNLILQSIAAYCTGIGHNIQRRVFGMIRNRAAVPRMGLCLLLSAFLADPGVHILIRTVPLAEIVIACQGNRCVCSIGADIRGAVFNNDGTGNVGFPECLVITNSESQNTNRPLEIGNRITCPNTYVFIVEILQHACFVPRMGINQCLQLLRIKDIGNCQSIAFDRFIQGNSQVNRCARNAFRI